MGWYHIMISRELQEFVRDHSTLELTSTPYQYFIISIAGLSVAFIVYRNKFNHFTIFPAVALFVGTALFKVRLQFYHYHDYPDYGDMKNVPECLKEENFNSFWEYLTQGCHLTLKGLTLSQTYKSLCWIVVFYFVLFLLNKWNKRRNPNQQLIDSV